LRQRAEEEMQSLRLALAKGSLTRDQLSENLKAQAAIKLKISSVKQNYMKYHLAFKNNKISNSVVLKARNSAKKTLSFYKEKLKQLKSQQIEIKSPIRRKDLLRLRNESERNNKLSRKEVKRAIEKLSKGKND